jgi:hypothetical protein
MLVMALRHRAVAFIMRSLLMVVLCALLIAPQAIAFMSGSDEDRSTSTPAPAAARTSPFKIKGQLEGLVPGKRNRLPLKLINDNRYTIKVKWLAVRASTSDTPGCEASSLKIPKRKSYSLTIAKKRKTEALYPIRLKKTAPARCQGAAWPLRFKGGGVRVR